MNVEILRKSVTLPAVELSYLERDRGSEPLLLLHGLADWSLVWASLAAHLSAPYHVVAPDLRGHGDSGKPETGYDFTDYISDLEALMEHLGWTSAHVLGHSWSGKLLAVWATQKPSRFRSLIFVDPFFIDRIPRWFQPTFPLLYRFLPFLKMMGPFASYEAAETQARQLKQYREWTPLQQEVFRGAIEPKADGTWGSKFVLPARDRAFEEVMTHAGLTQTLDIPSLFVKPERGLNRTEWQLKSYKTYLSDLKIVGVPGNHWPFLVEPDAFNQVVQDFLNQQI